MCAQLQDFTISSTASESAPASSNTKRNAAIAAPTVIGGVAIIGAHGLCISFLPANVILQDTLSHVPQQRMPDLKFET